MALALSLLEIRSQGKSTVWRVSLNAQGEDVVAGIRTPEPIRRLRLTMPKVYQDFRHYAELLEYHYRDMQDIEFTIENEKLYILQTRNGKRTAAAYG